MKLSIVVPCYNEEDGISNLVSKLKVLENKIKKDYELEFLFIDDGSKDNTNKLLHKYFGKKKHCKIIKHEKNMNVGAAIRTGFNNATGDLIANIDSDCTYDPIEIANMLKLIKDVDIVTASPYHPDGKVIGASNYRLFLSKNATFIYRIISGSNLYCYTAMFRIYKNKVKNIKFKSNDFLAPAEILILALLKGYKVKEYPITLKRREFGQSHLKVIKAIKSHLKFMFYILNLRLFGVKNG